MKLNKAELNAVANKIVRDIKEENELAKQAFLKEVEPMISDEADVLVEQIKNLSPELINFLSDTRWTKRELENPEPHARRHIADHFLDGFEAPLKVDCSRYYIESKITDDLIIAQLECKDLDEMIKKVIDRYR